MRRQVYVILGRVSENNRLTAWFRQRCRVLANVDSGMCMVLPFMHLLAEGYYFPFTGSGMISVILSECIYHPLYLSDLIHPGKEGYITRHSADWYKQSRFRDKVCSNISPHFIVLISCTEVRYPPLRLFNASSHCGPVPWRYLLRPHRANRFEQGLCPSLTSTLWLNRPCRVSTSFRSR